MSDRKRNAYQDANSNDSEVHPIDEELERRLRHAALRKQIRTAQDQVLTALGKRRELFLHLEQLIGERHIDREEAMFNLGFEHGLVRGRTEALAASVRRPGARGRELTKQFAQLAMNAGIEPPRTLAALLEVAWAMALEPREPPTQRSPKVPGAKK